MRRTVGTKQGGAGQPQRVHRVLHGEDVGRTFVQQLGEYVAGRGHACGVLLSRLGTVGRWASEQLVEVGRTIRERRLP